MKRKKKKKSTGFLTLPRKCGAQGYEGNCWFKDAICIHCGFNPFSTK